jgi:cobalt/nickel transport system permease protein
LLFIILSPANAYKNFFLYAAVIFIQILLCRIPLLKVIKRSLVVIPFVLVAAIFIPFIKEGEVIGSYSLGYFNAELTRQGLLIFWNISIKAYLSTLCLILLIATTRFTELLKGLEKMKFPRVIILILSFMYRYIFVIYDELLKIVRSKEARSVTGFRLSDIKIFSNIIGVLFIKSYERAEAVYLAMLSRGFEGQVNIFTELKFRGRDIFFMAILIITFIIIKFIR